MIYNLGENARNDIQFDNAIDARLNAPVGLSLTFRAGYESEGYMPTLFAGRLLRAFSYREGATVITEIQVLDNCNALQYAQVEQTFAADVWKTKRKECVQQLMGLMRPYGVSIGAIGTLFNGMQSTRGVTFVGSVWEVLKRLAAGRGGYACMDQGKAFLMSQSDALVVPGAIPKLDASTGLIDTPRRSGWIVDARMLFEPRVQLMQEINVESSANANINGTYIVQAVSHSGIISRAKDGGAVTSLSLMTPPDEINRIVQESEVGNSGAIPR